jgi:hypothetical protein
MATFNSTVTCGTTNLNGTFDYTPPNPPNLQNGSVITQYTLTSSNTTVPTTSASSTGASVGFSISVGGTTYTFNGAYAKGNGTIVGRVNPCSNAEGDPDNWTASA